MYRDRGKHVDSAKNLYSERDIKIVKNRDIFKEKYNGNKIVK